MRQQVRAIFHIITNIERERNLHFFSSWRKFTNDSQTLAAAEDLRRMTEAVPSSSSPVKSPVRSYEEPRAQLEELNVGMMDIFKMGADLGLISKEEV